MQRWVADSKAIELALKVRDARIKKYGLGHPLTLDALDSLAGRYQSVGRMAQALALYEQVRDEMVVKLSADHPNTIAILEHLARMYVAFRRTDAAISVAEHVRDSRMSTLGAFHPHTIQTLETLGLAYKAGKQPDKVLAALQQAATGLEKTEFVHVRAGRIMGNLIDCLEQAGQFDQADRWRQKWLATVKTRQGPDSLAYADARYFEGENLLMAKRHAQGAPLLRECLNILETKHPPTWKAFHVRSLLGGVLLGQKQYAEAEPLVVEGYEGLKSRQAEIPTLFARHFISEAGERILRLYDAWGRPDEAARWRAKLSQEGKSTSARGPSHSMAVPGGSQDGEHPDPR